MDSGSVAGSCALTADAGPALAATWLLRLRKRSCLLWLLGVFSIMRGLSIAAALARGDRESAVTGSVVCVVTYVDEQNKRMIVVKESGVYIF